MKGLRSIAFAAIVMVSGYTGAHAASKAVHMPACDGVDMHLSPSSRHEYAALVAQSVTTGVKPAQVSLHTFIASGSWSAVYASIPDSEDGFFFFKESGGRKRFKEVWGGWAASSEKPELIEWARQLGVPASLAACFADVVTRR